MVNWVTRRPLYPTFAFYFLKSFTGFVVRARHRRVQYLEHNTEQCVQYCELYGFRLSKCREEEQRHQHHYSPYVRIHGDI